jgi:serine/threonine protein kinase
MLTPYEEALAVGSRFLDRYQIISVVGRGSMGIVYKARHELMGRLVAIKMLRGQLQKDERSIKRFEREARAASRLDHQNVITVHDFGLTEQRQPYMVMDFASGITLHEIQKKERVLSPDRAVHIFSQVCDALHHAHLNGVIHRDLKPSNIMILQKDDQKDLVKVFDLGVAKIAWGEEEEKEALTGTGEVCGSPVYLSPEQCVHEELDIRTDIYSLGVVMYELLTGVPPLMGETVYDTIYMHVHETPPPFSQVTDLPIPKRLENIVLKALSKNREERQQTMQEVKWELQAALEVSEPVRILAPDALGVQKKRPSQAAPEREEPTKQSRSIVISQRMALRNGSVSMQDSQAALPPPPTPRPAAEAAALPAEKSQNPMVMTAILSSVVSIIATLGLLAVFNAGKNPTRMVQPEPDSKMLNLSRLQQAEKNALSHKALPPPAVKTHQQDSASGLKPKPIVAPLETAHSPEPAQLPKEAAVKAPGATHAPKGATGLKPIKAPPKVAEVADTPPEPTPAPEQNNGFFSIFSFGKPAPTESATPPGPQPLMATAKALPTAVQKTAQQKSVKGKKGQLAPKLAPVEQPQYLAAQPQYAPVDGASPQAQQSQQAVSEDDQRAAIILNNEAVAVLGQNPQGAISKLERALRINPNYARARKNLGRAWHNLANQQRASGDTFSAVNSYRKSLNILTDASGPSDPDTQTAKQDYENLLQTAGAN